MTHDYATNSPVFFDFETQSPVDLKRCGGLRYAESPDTRVLSLSVLLDRKLIVWLPQCVGHALPKIELPLQYKELYDELLVYATDKLPSIIDDATHDNRVFVAHNMAHFDYHVWNECIAKRGLGSLPSRWADTLFLARIAGLPAGGLDAIAERMLGASKDSAKRLVLPLCFSEYVNGRCVHKSIPSGLVEPLIRYCSVDTLILPLLWEKFADLRVEADVIQEHQEINDRGIAVDLRLAAKISEVAAYASERAAVEIERITGGVLHGEKPDASDPKKRKGNLRSTKQVHEWLETQGVRIVGIFGDEKKKTLRSEVVEKHLANPLMMVSHDAELNLVATGKTDDIPDAVYDVLRLRQSAIRITSAKTDRMVDRRSKCGRIRDLFTYHKAHTGRWSSGGVQIHNLPRGKRGIPVGRILEYYENGKWSGDVKEAYEHIQSFLPVESEKQKRVTVDDALSALIRPCFVAESGKKLAIADFAAIEGRGIAWLAGEEKLLDAYRNGDDVYCIMSSTVYGREITPDDKDERQLGKILILAANYGMGPEKFALTCSLQGLNLSKLGVSAEKCIETYRATYPAIAGDYSGCDPYTGRAYRRGGIWDKLNRAAMNAVLEGGMQYAGKYIRYYWEKGNLHCVLPSGRTMIYCNCRIEDRVPGYAKAYSTSRTKPTLVYDSQYGSESVLYGGKLAENVTQAAMRDIMACSMVEMGKTDYPIIATVHDEEITECDEILAADALQTLCEKMSHSPSWAAELPISVEGHTARRYMKEAPIGEYICKASGGRVTHFYVKEEKR